MKEFAHFRGQFEGWTESQRRELLRNLVDIIISTAIYGFVCAVSAPDYRGVFPGGKQDDPYFVCFQECILRMIERAMDTPEKREQVGFVFDCRQDAPSVVRLWERMKALSAGQPEEPYMGPFAMGDEKQYPPLQAADLLAFEGRDAIEELLQGKDRLMRWPLARLTMVGRVDYSIYRREDLEELRASPGWLKARGLI